MADTPYPHSDILDRLIESTMAAMGSCYNLMSDKMKKRDVVSFTAAVDAVPDKSINDHFDWWESHYKTGEMRHIGSKDPKNSNVPIVGKGGKVTTYPTRISKIIKRIIKTTFSDNYTPNSQNYWTPSPLFIVEELLASPTSPSFSAYTLYAIRTFLFFRFEAVPSGLLGRTSFVDFTEEDIQRLYSAILTSTAPRYESQGKDTLVTQFFAGGVLQQYLAYRNILVLSFQDLKKAAAYCKSKDICLKKKTRVFQKNGSISRMPEIAQVINELWGVPVPIRGGDTIFRGGLKLSSERGLVIAVHGGPGTGKTSLCLALCAALSPFGIQTVFMSAEEHRADLTKRSLSLFSDEMRRLPFMKAIIKDGKNTKVHFDHIPVLDNDDDFDGITNLERKLNFLKRKFGDEPDSIKLPIEYDKLKEKAAVPKPCRAIIVIDGLHDLFIGKKNKEKLQKMKKLHQLVDQLQSMNAIVIITIADDWDVGASLDYMVDMAIRLNFTEVEAYDAKPDRRLTLFKARHQQCAFGTHGLQISGDKGVRFSPQINHQLDRRAVWKTRLPDNTFLNPTFSNAHKISNNLRPKSRNNSEYVHVEHGVEIPRGSNIFINGNGSGGKAGLAMRIAFTPVSKTSANLMVASNEKVLVISFLYPRDYYSEVLKILNKAFTKEYRTKPITGKRLEVIHLYPGYLKPNDLYNRIDWEIQSAERVGEPYTTVIVDGLHNVFLQFPEIQKYPIFWPQLYNALRSRPLNIITTHTTLVMQDDQYAHSTGPMFIVDDDRSEPLRHALVQKTDFQITVEPSQPSDIPGLFGVNFLSAIGQKVQKDNLFWERETLKLFVKQASDPVSKD